MGTFVQDLKHSVRMFGQSKAFTATAIAALALGIGATTAIFSIVNAVLLKPVPFPNPDFGAPRKVFNARVLQFSLKYTF